MSFMWSIIDKRSPEEVKLQLKRFGLAVEFATYDIVYPAISGHPDIFICQTTPQQVIVAPNTPLEYMDVLQSKRIEIILGAKPLGDRYPQTALYNALFTPEYLICNSKYIDVSVINQIDKRTLIHVNQGYVRCNTMYLGHNSFITSDLPTYSTLKKKDANIIYVTPESIGIKDLAHGFIGGTMGIYNNQLFINGTLKNHPDQDKIINLCNDIEVKIINLSSTNLYDGGGILIFD